MTYTEKNRQAIYRWRAKNPEKLKEVNNRANQRYYDRMKGILAGKYKLEVEWTRLRAIDVVLY